MSSPGGRVMLIRQLHAWLSVFVAPTVLFFACTGALQLFSLHEAHGDYHPAPLIEKLGMLHKDQKFALKPHHADSKLRTPVGAIEPERSEAARAAPARGEGDWVAPIKASAPEDAAPARVQALKVFFCAAAVMLIFTTLMGVWMALTQHRQKWVLLVLLMLGAAAPVAILTLL